MLVNQESDLYSYCSLTHLSKTSFSIMEIKKKDTEYDKGALFMGLVLGDSKYYTERTEGAVPWRAFIISHRGTQRMACGMRMPGFRSCLYHVQTKWPWASPLISPWRSISNGKMETSRCLPLSVVRTTLFNTLFKLSEECLSHRKPSVHTTIVITMAWGPDLSVVYLDSCHNIKKKNTELSHWSTWGPFSFSQEHPAAALWG